MIWSIWTQFPQLVSLLKYLWNRYSSTHRGPWHYSKVSLDVKQGAEDFGLVFMCPCIWFGVFGSSFPKLPQYLSTWETVIFRPTEGLDTIAYGPFLWPCTWFRGIWALFPQIALMSKYLKNRFNSIVRWSRQKSKTSVDVKCGVENYGLF